MAPTECLTEAPPAVQHLMDLLHKSKSRRFGCGMELSSGPLSYHSHHEPLALSPEEEDYLIFAAVGATGLNLGDMQFLRQNTVGGTVTVVRPQRLAELAKPQSGSGAADTGETANQTSIA